MSQSFETPPVDPQALQEADALVQAGLAASQANDADRALDLFAQATAACPSSGIPHFLAGSEYAARGQIDRAEAELANAVLLAPSLHIARYQLGLLQFSTGRAAAAIVTWGPLFDLDDTHPLGHFVRGFTALAHDEFAQPKSHFEEGLARNTENAALSHDILQILRGIQDAQGQAAGSAPPQEPNSGDAAHVLLSNYGRFGGTLH